jgi:hypothetical protein
MADSRLYLQYPRVRSSALFVFARILLRKAAAKKQHMTIIFSTYNAELYYSQITYQ